MTVRRRSDDRPIGSSTLVNRPCEFGPAAWLEDSAREFLHDSRSTVRELRAALVRVSKAFEVDRSPHTLAERGRLRYAIDELEREREHAKALLARGVPKTWSELDAIAVVVTPRAPRHRAT